MTSGRNDSAVDTIRIVSCLCVLLGLAASCANLLAAPQGPTITGCGPLVPSDAVPFNPPRFVDYPVVSIFDGPPAMPNWKRDARARQFRTALTNSVAQGPNFAGHFAIAGWGCGASCLQFAIVDVRSGHVFFPPRIKNVSTVHVGTDTEEADVKFNALRFRVDSNLLIVLGAINENESSEGISYYKWTGTSLVHVHTILSRKGRC